MKKQKRQIDFKYFILGVSLFAVAWFIHGPIEEYSRDNIYNPSIFFVSMGIAMIYISIRNSVYSLYKKDILEDNFFNWTLVLIFTVSPMLLLIALLIFTPDLVQNLLRGI
jgi:hypothetical protein